MDAVNCFVKVKKWLSCTRIQGIRTHRSFCVAFILPSAAGPYSMKEEWNKCGGIGTSNWIRNGESKLCKVLRRTFRMTTTLTEHLSGARLTNPIPGNMSCVHWNQIKLYSPLCLIFTWWGTDKRVIPRQMLQSLRVPVFGILHMTSRFVQSIYFVTLFGISSQSTNQHGFV